MPLTGSNHNNLKISHNDLGVYEQLSGEISPILTEFIYPVGEFIKYISGNLPDYSVTLFGRSGGAGEVMSLGLCMMLIMLSQLLAVHLIQCDFPHHGPYTN